MEQEKGEAKTVNRLRFPFFLLFYVGMTFA